MRVPHQIQRKQAVTWHVTVSAVAALVAAVPACGQTAMPPAAAAPGGAPDALDMRGYASFVAEASARFGIPQAWILALIDAESRGDPFAVSPAGAMGLTQLMPATWAFERARLGLGDDPFDRRDNILAGVDYLRAMRERYGPIGMLAAYNAGPGRYEDYRRSGRPLPGETLAYVRRLAPAIVSDVTTTDRLEVRADPLAWRRASLFSERAAAAPAALAMNAPSPSLDRLDSAANGSPWAERALAMDNRAANIEPQSSIFVALAPPQQ